MVFFGFLQLFKYGVHRWTKRQGLHGATGNVPCVPSSSKHLLSIFKASAAGCEEDLRACSASPQAAEDISLLALAAGMGPQLPPPTHFGFLWPHCEKSISCSKCKSSKGFSGCHIGI